MNYLDFAPNKAYHDLYFDIYQFHYYQPKYFILIYCEIFVCFNFSRQVIQRFLAFFEKRMHPS